VGTGLITQNTHLPTALSLPGVEVCALVDPVIERAKSLAQNYAIKPLIATRADEVIGRVDAAIVATPNHTHRSVAVPLLEAGISTLIEKPLASTVEDGEAIVEAAERGAAKVALAYYQRFLDAPRLLKVLLDQQYFGQVFRFTHQFGTPGGWPSLSAYTLKREYIGGGVLVVTGTHFLDRMLHTWGRPDEVQLHDDSKGGPEGHCEGTVRYVEQRATPLDGFVRYSKSVALPAGIVLQTERGIVMLRDGFADDITLIPADRPDLRLKIVCPSQNALFPAGLNPFQRMLWDFTRACLDDRQPEIDGRQGLDSLRLIQRFYQQRRPLAETWV
jgi:predicted dehydrogenase